MGRTGRETGLSIRMLWNRGGVIEFELGAEMKTWDTAEVPPSPGHYVL